MNATRTLLAVLAASACVAAQADELSVISFGGANKEAQIKAYYEPFSKIFDSIHVKRSGLDIELDPNQVKNGILTVEFSHDTGKLNYKIQR